MSVLTEFELASLDSRLDDIDAVIDLCDPNFDADVLENLERELIQIQRRLEASLKELEAA